MSLLEYLNMTSPVDIGLDLGTANILLYHQEKGIVLNEPSMVAKERGTGNVIAVGQEALDIHEKVHPGIVTVRPIASGVIADYEATTVMVRTMISKVATRSVFGLRRLIVSVPLGITPVEKRAVLDAAEKVGVKEIAFIAEPVAAAIGLGLDPFAATGHMVIDIGGGTSDIAVITLGGIASGESLRIAGTDFNSRIIQFFRNRYNLAISDYAAENLKLQSVCVYDKDENSTMTVQGMNVGTGLPETITVDSRPLNDSVDHLVSQMIAAIRKHIEALIVKPELAIDILEKGIYLTGGGSQLKGLNKRIQEETTLPVVTSDDPMTDVIKGVGEILADLDHYKPLLAIDYKALVKEDS
ncbi:rod shape-determining protein [Prosthecochloris sp. N3]|uniref:Cell shape-determining protein MreB n=1 Tax=Prosthecochloris ethylica TaxID=2743976 RepID=A0ABR9XPQ1_9CHLB|nr:rod shape-determining protein [Prosthecochloris ethylica]MBF0586253.1 rod shape-determining protein [Prosthecochloris ethylica]MBF0635959.1 rod shape-determining protein [Prosthecochloris ethylica]NUK47366.1 rod shape-determining protein [Prosthecochloris ethylica]